MLRRRNSDSQQWGPVRVVGFLAVVVIGAYLVAARPWLYAMSAGPTRNGVALVVAVTSGVRGNLGASYSYRVRLDDGTEADVTLSDALAPGTRLRLAYSRGWLGRLNVLAYQQCPGGCAP